MLDESFATALSHLPVAVLTDPAECLVYSGDASLCQGLPAAVILPENLEEISAAMKLAAEHGVCIVPRGAGTGLVGGAAPSDQDVIIALNRMRSIDDSHIADGLLLASPGATVQELETTAAQSMWHYAPDPGSGQTCTVGGTVSTNAGGPHAWTGYSTRDAVSQITMVLADGSSTRLGGLTSEWPGVDLAGLVSGSEGTLGIIAGAALRLSRPQQACAGLVAVFDELVDAVSAGVALSGDGVDIDAIEVVDALLVDTVNPERRGLPSSGSHAVLLAQVCGSSDSLTGALDRIALLCGREGALNMGRHTGEDGGRQMWDGWRKTIGSVGRLAAPTRWVGLATKPSKLVETIEGLQKLARDHQREVGWLIHAGDGGIQAAVPTTLDAASADPFVEQMWRLCSSFGGVPTGEHGVGRLNKAAPAIVLSEATFEAKRGIKRIFDDRVCLNRGTWPPERADRRVDRSDEAVEYRTVVHLTELISSVAASSEATAVKPNSAKEVARTLRAAASDGVSLAVHGTPSDRVVDIQLDRLSEIGPWNPEDRAITVGPGVKVCDLDKLVRSLGWRWPVDPPAVMGETVGQALAYRRTGPQKLGWGDIREHVLGVELATTRGDLIRCGGPTIRHRAGYDLRALAVGARHSLGVITEATLRLRPRPDAQGALIAVFDTVDGCGLAAKTWLKLGGGTASLHPTAVVVMSVSGELTLDRDWQMVLDADRYTAVVGFEGTEESVKTQLNSAAAVGRTFEMTDQVLLKESRADNVWTAISMMRGTEGVDWRTNTRARFHIPTSLGVWLLEVLQNRLPDNSEAEIVGDVGCGVVELVIGHDDDGWLAGWLYDQGELVVEDGGWLEVVDGPYLGTVIADEDPVATRLACDLKSEMDPSGTLPEWKHTAPSLPASDSSSDTE